MSSYRAHEIAGSPSKIGGSTNRNMYFSRFAHKKEHSAPALRIGEIIRGTVTDISSPRFAQVRLPMGTFTAELHGRLKRGDSLFLKVVETSPALLLKVHSVSPVQNGRVLPVKSILRILDLPDDSLYYQIAEVLAELAPAVLRKESLIIHNAVTKLNKEKKHNKSNLILIETAFYLISAHKDFNPDNLLYMSEAFCTIYEIQQKIQEIVVQAKIENYNPILKFLNNIPANGFGLWTNQDDSLCSVCAKKIAEYGQSELKTICTDFVRFCGAVMEWNATALENDMAASLFWIFSAGNNNYIPARILLFSVKKALDKENPDFELLIKNAIEKVNPISLGTEIIQEDMTSLNNFASVLSKELMNNGLILSSFAVNASEDEVECLEKTPPPPPKSFSVVV